MNYSLVMKKGIHNLKLPHCIIMHYLHVDEYPLYHYVFWSMHLPVIRERGPGTRLLSHCTDWLGRSLSCTASLTG